MFNIAVSGDSRFPVDRRRIRETVSRVLKEFGVTEGVAVSLRIVGDRKMRQLNEGYRDKKGTTDVLSFPTESKGNKGIGFVYPEKAAFPLGDIVISYPQARMQAAEGNLFVDDEIEALVVHGVKSLLGEHS